MTRSFMFFIYFFYLFIRLPEILVCSLFFFVMYDVHYNSEQFALILLLFYWKQNAADTIRAVRYNSAIKNGEWNATACE